MIIEKNNLQKILSKRINKGVKVEGTWDKDNNEWNAFDKKHIQEIRHFYSNSFRKGLIEYPEKRPHPKPYSTNKFNLKFYINSYLKTKFNQKNIKANLEQIFLTYNGLGIDYPEFDSKDKDFYYDIDGFAFNHNLRKYSEFILILRQFMEMKDLHVCEIGGGYGGLAELMITNNHVNNYLIIDLFQTLSVSMSYLIEKVSDKYRLHLVENGEDLKDVSGDYNILFVPVDAYMNIKDLIIEKYKINLFINSSSFVEMSMDYVNEYFSFIQQFKDTYLFSYNKIKRLEQGNVMSAYKFPYDDKFKHIFTREDKRYGELFRLSHRP